MAQLFSDFEKVMAFVKRDMLSVVTYKTNLALSLLNTFMAAMVWSLLGQNVQLSSSLARYGGSFISYLIIGVAFNEYMMESLRAVQKSIKPTTLEDVLSAPIRMRVFIIGNVLWGYIWHSINVFVYFAIGVVLFGMSLVSVDVLGTILVLGLGIAVMFSFSLLASGFLFITKEGDVINWLLAVLAEVFAGVYFPIAILPAQLQIVSWLLPQTYFFELIRLALSGHQLIALQLGPMSITTLALLVLDAIVIVLLAAILLSIGTRSKGSRKRKALFAGVLAAAAVSLNLFLSSTATLDISIHPLLSELILYTLIMVPLGYLAFKKGLDAAKKRGTLSHI